jgi:hypothetical protein
MKLEQAAPTVYLQQSSVSVRSNKLCKKVDFASSWKSQRIKQSSVATKCKKKQK